jgi:hypothetical protein
MQNKKNKKNIGKNLGNKIFKLLTTNIYSPKKNLSFQKQSNKFCKKPKENIYLLPLCDLSKLIFSIFFEKNID